VSVQDRDSIISGRLEGLRQEQVILFLAMSHLPEAMPRSRRAPKKARFGPRRAVIGVCASPVCNAERLPWNEV